MANREYKSDVFSMLLEDRARALDVYNAMAGTAYTDPEIIEIHTLESGVSLTVHNDASFVVSMDSVLNIYEHQSTYNPNMPLRELIYFVTIIKKLVENRNLFSHKLVKIPTPKFAVFYNGGETRPEREVLRLSDAYENQSDEPQLELMCTVYNINPGNNEDLKKRSQTLREYMIFVGYVNENLAKAKKSGKDYETAIRDAVNRCIAEDILTLAGGVGVCLTGRAAKAAETTAKDITEDIAQIDPIAAKAAEAARAAAVLGCIAGIHTGKAVLIVQLALLRVRKHLVGFIDFLELFLGILIAGVVVRVVLHGQLAVSLFDLRIGGRFGYSQHFVVIALFLCHNHTSIKPAKAAPAKPERLLLLSGTPARRFGRASAVCVRT